MIDQYVVESNEFVPVVVANGEVPFTDPTGITFSVVPVTNGRAPRPAAYVAAVSYQSQIGFYSGGYALGIYAVFAKYTGAAGQTPVEYAGRVEFI